MSESIFIINKEYINACLHICSQLKNIPYICIFVTFKIWRPCVDHTYKTKDVETLEYKNIWKKYFLLNILHFQWENICLSILIISYDNDNTLFPQTALVIHCSENIRHIKTNTLILSTCVRKIYS